MKIFLDEADLAKNLAPFSKTRPVSALRIGILTLREKWNYLLGPDTITSNKAGADLVFPANIIATPSNIDQLLAGNAINPDWLIHYSWELFLKNDFALREDFELLTRGQISKVIGSNNNYMAPENIFVEEGAVINSSSINASTGPVYIGKNSTIMEGCLIRGPFALCEGATLKMGTQIYGATTIGPGCVAGGEVKNAIMFGYSNKGHHGYLGDSVIGEWCNLGAGTSNSNVKNTGGLVRYKINEFGDFMQAGNKGGVLMGDYSRCAINTSFNTATVVGVCCNIFEDVSQNKFIPDFSWGHEIYNFEKVKTDIANWKKMKGQDFTQAEIELLEKLYNKK